MNSIHSRIVLALLALVAAALPRLGGAQSASRGARSAVDTLALHATLRQAQATMVATFVSGDTTQSAPLWCADYRAASGGVPVDRDSVLRQFTASNRARRPSYGYAPADPAGGVIVTLSDTAVLISATFAHDFGWGEGRWIERRLVSHEFRRRRGKWCAVRGRTTPLGPAVRQS